VVIQQRAGFFGSKICNNFAEKFDRADFATYR
jgi:hypothetical protein